MNCDIYPQPKLGAEFYLITDSNASPFYTYRGDLLYGG